MIASRILFAGMILGAITFAIAPLHAAEPQVAFVVQDGWVELTLTQDDKPLPDAQVIVFDSMGTKFADGETGPAGKGEFPIPPGSNFRIEIKIGERTADPIQLTKLDGQLFPSNILLSFGLLPCCRVPSLGVAGFEPTSAKTVSPSSVAIPIWAQTLLGISFTALGCTLLWICLHTIQPFKCFISRLKHE